MKRMRQFSSFFSAVFLAAMPLLAHSDKESTIPADGAILERAPTHIEMTFDSPMRLTMVRLTDAEGGDIELQRSDGMAPVTQFQAVPATLLPGAYTVEWRGLSGDGHPMQGSFSFEIAN